MLFLTLEPPFSSLIFTSSIILILLCVFQQTDSCMNIYSQFVPEIHTLPPLSLKIFPPYNTAHLLSSPFNVYSNRLTRIYQHFIPQHAHSCSPNALLCPRLSPVRLYSHFFLVVSQYVHVCLSHPDVHINMLLCSLCISTSCLSRFFFSCFYPLFTF